MPDTLPTWFAADQVFNTEDGWFVGVTDGFRIGPFAQQSQAEQHSRDLSAQLRRCYNTTEMVRVVREFVFEQTSRHGRQVRSGLRPPESAAATAGPDSPPPVRAGELARVWFRTNRVYAVGDVWFFSTREGIDIGPYASREQAERDLECLIDILRRNRDPDRNLAAIRRFMDGVSANSAR